MLAAVAVVAIVRALLEVVVLQLAGMAVNLLARVETHHQLTGVAVVVVVQQPADLEVAVL